MKVKLNRKIIYGVGAICVLIIGFGLYLYRYLGSMDELVVSWQHPKITVPQISQPVEQPEIKPEVSGVDISSLVTDEMINGWIDPIINENLNRDNLRSWVKEMWNPSKEELLAKVNEIEAELTAKQGQFNNPAELQASMQQTIMPKMREWVRGNVQPKMQERVQEIVMNTVQPNAMSIMREKLRDIFADLESKGQGLSMEEKETVKNTVQTTIQGKVRAKMEKHMTTAMPEIMPELIRPIMQTIMQQKMRGKMKMGGGGQKPGGPGGGKPSGGQ